MKILCAIDFTRPAEEAALAAHALARHCGASLELLHVCSVSGLDEKDASMKTLLTGARSRLSQRAERFTQDGVPTTTEVLTLSGRHSLSEAVIRYAAELPANLLVISTHGKSGSKLWPMGSLAAKIVESAAMPVLVVHSAKRFLKWKHPEGESLRIFLGLDLSEEAEQILHAVHQLGLDRSTSLTAGYAQQVVYPLTAEPWQVMPAMPTVYAQDEALLEDRLRKLISTHLPDSAAAVRVHTGFSTAAHELVEMASEEHSDLVVVGVHQRHGVRRLVEGSVSRGVLRESPVSMLCVPLHEIKAANAPAPNPSPPLPNALPNILCATDFTGRSSEAALAAQELALRFGVSFEVVHVIEDALSWPALPHNILQDIHDGAEARLKEFCYPLRARGLSPKRTVVQARDHEPVAECLLDYLNKYRPMMCVISTHGKSESSWWPLGSAAMKIGSASPVPVLIVKSAEVFRRWIEQDAKLRILGAVDATNNTQTILSWMKKIGEAGDCAYTLVHIDQLHGSPCITNPPMPKPTEKSSSLALVKAGLHAMGVAVLGEKSDLTTVVDESWESIVDRLNDIAHNSHTDLIIVGAHQWHGVKRLMFESVYRGLIERSEASLLCLPVIKDSAEPG